MPEAESTALAERIDSDRKGAGWGRASWRRPLQFEPSSHRRPRVGDVACRCAPSLDAAVAASPQARSRRGEEEPAVAAGGFCSGPRPTSHRSVVDSFGERIPRAGLRPSTRRSRRCDRGVACNSCQPPTRRTPRRGLGGPPCPRRYCVHRRTRWGTGGAGKGAVGLCTGVACDGVAVPWRQTRARMTGVNWCRGWTATSAAVRERPAAGLPARSGVLPRLGARRPTPSSPSGECGAPDRPVPVTCCEAVRWCWRR